MGRVGVLSIFIILCVSAEAHKELNAKHRLVPSSQLLSQETTEKHMPSSVYLEVDQVTLPTTVMLTRTTKAKAGFSQVTAKVVPEKSTDEMAGCIPGFHYTASGACHECPPGTYTDATQHERHFKRYCAVCLPGTYASGTGNSQCQDCPQGKYSAVPGSESCLQCGVGMFQDHVGKSSCEACERSAPVDMLRCHPAVSRAVCAPTGWFCSCLQPNQWYSVQNQTCVQCTACEEGFVVEKECGLEEDRRCTANTDAKTVFTAWMNKKLSALQSGANSTAPFSWVTEATSVVSAQGDSNLRATIQATESRAAWAATVMAMGILIGFVFVALYHCGGMGPHDIECGVPAINYVTEDEVVNTTNFVSHWVTGMNTGNHQLLTWKIMDLLKTTHEEAKQSIQRKNPSSKRKIFSVPEKMKIWAQLGYAIKSAFSDLNVSDDDGVWKAFNKIFSYRSATCVIKYTKKALATMHEDIDDLIAFETVLDMLDADKYKKMMCYVKQDMKDQKSASSYVLMLRAWYGDAPITRALARKRHRTEEPVEEKRDDKRDPMKGFDFRTIWDGKPLEPTAEVAVAAKASPQTAAFEEEVKEDPSHDKHEPVEEIDADDPTGLTEADGKERGYCVAGLNFGKTLKLFGVTLNPDLLQKIPKEC